MRPYILAETNWRAVRETAFEVAVLPWGATEAHNYHLPYGTDTIQCDHVAAEAARIAWEEGARVVVLPTVPFGVQTGQLDVPFALNVNPSTQLALLRDLAHTLDRHGVPKLVVLNGHGGNDFRQMLRELQAEVDTFLCAANWYQSVDLHGHFEDHGDHAGEMETSVMMHVAPGLCLELSQAGTGAAKRFRIPALREGWAWSQRRWSQVTEDTGVGDPRAATAAKGERYLAAVTATIGAFLVDLAAADPECMYE